MRPANERRRYTVTPSLIGWVHTQNDPWQVFVGVESVQVFWNVSANQYHLEKKIMIFKP